MQAAGLCGLSLSPGAAGENPFPFLESGGFSEKPTAGQTSGARARSFRSSVPSPRVGASLETPDTHSRLAVTG